MSDSLGKYKMFAGNASMGFGVSMAKHLGISLSNRMLKEFSDREIRVQIEESVRGHEVVLVQSLCSNEDKNKSVNDYLMELLIMADAAKRASASSIIAVIPYYGYARQDRKVHSRAPITARLVADMLTAAGVAHVVTVDLHASQIQGFFNVPVDNLYAWPTLEKAVQASGQIPEVVVSPDAGGVTRARAFAKAIGSRVAIIDKRREGPNESEVMNIVGDVGGCYSLLADDMVDTAGTLVGAAVALDKKGSKIVDAVASHGVLSGPAIERIEDSPIRYLYVSTTIELHERAKACKKIIEVPIEPVVADALRLMAERGSVSSLFR